MRITYVDLGVDGPAAIRPAAHGLVGLSLWHDRRDMNDIYVARQEGREYWYPPYRHTSREYVDHVEWKTTHIWSARGDGAKKKRIYYGPKLTQRYP